MAEICNPFQNPKGRIFHNRLMCLGMTFETILNLYQHEQLRSEVFESMAGLLASIMACPGAQQFWSGGGRINNAPPYMRAYLAGTLPDGREVQPFNANHEFL